MCTHTHAHTHARVHVGTGEIQIRLIIILIGLHECQLPDLNNARGCVSYEGNLGERYTGTLCTNFATSCVS